MQTDSEGTRPSVIVRQTFHHVLQRDNAGGGNDTGLPHRSADHPPVGAGTFDKCRAAAKHRTDGRTQPFAHAEGYAVAIARYLGCGNAERDGRIKKPCTVDMNRDGVFIRHRAQLRQTSEGQHRTAIVVMCRLYADECGCDAARRRLAMDELTNGRYVRRAALGRINDWKQPGKLGDAAKLAAHDMRTLV